MEVAGLVYWTLGGVLRSCRRDTAVRGGIGKAQDRCWPFSTCFFLLALSKTERDGGVLQLHFYFYLFLS